jgi:phenylalanyl-tRNA synthetase beta chain
MNIPLDWLKEYVDIKGKKPQEIANSFTSLGLLLDKPIKDDVLDLEHRMDRSDWLSILGCARDYAAFEGLKLKYPESYTEKGKTPTQEQVVKIGVECPEVVNRFTTRVFRGIKVKESPKWLKERLEAYGIPSKNNIVDITNYVMVEYGQPLHAQDLSKMRAQEIVIRCARPGEKVVTMLGDEVELTKGQFVLTQAGVPTVIGGIVGGRETAVDEQTVDIVLDAGNYNQVNIRRSSRKLKILNETVLRSDKFLHPELTEVAILRATKLILDLAGGEYYENEDWYPNKVPPKEMKLRYNRVKMIGGMEIKPFKIKEILQALEYKILAEDDEGLTLEVPYFRTDVVVEDDIVADIYRINDYEKIPVTKISAAPPKEITPNIYRFEDRLRDIMVNLGAHEHITDALVKEGPVTLENALNSEKSALRGSIRETLLPVLENYRKHTKGEINLFEVGRIYDTEGKGNKHENYKEIRVLEFLHDSTKPKYIKSKWTKAVLAGLLRDVGITDYKLEDGKILVDDIVVGTLGADGFTIFNENLMPYETIPQRITSEVQALTKENLSLVVDAGAVYGPIFEEIKKHNKSIVEVQLVEEYLADMKTTGKKAVFFKISYSTSDTQDIRKSLLKVLKKKYGAVLRE